MRALNLIYSFSIYIAVNLILYRRDWSEKRARSARIHGSGKVGTNVSQPFEQESGGRTVASRSQSFKQERSSSLQTIREGSGSREIVEWEPDGGYQSTQSAPGDLASVKR